MAIIDFGIPITKEQYRFIIQTTLTLVANNYAHILQSNITKKSIDNVYASFTKTKVASNSLLQKFVLDTADSLQKDIPSLKKGFCYFSINLIIKRLVPLLNIDKESETFLDAPLNKNELACIPTCYRIISSVKNKKDYITLMEAAHKKASSRGISLYEWELREFNL